MENLLTAVEDAMTTKGFHKFQPSLDEQLLRIKKEFSINAKAFSHEYSLYFNVDISGGYGQMFQTCYIKFNA